MTALQIEVFAKSFKIHIFKRFMATTNKKKFLLIFKRKLLKSSRDPHENCSRLLPILVVVT